MTLSLATKYAGMTRALRRTKWYELDGLLLNFPLRDQAPIGKILALAETALLDKRRIRRAIMRLRRAMPKRMIAVQEARETLKARLLAFKPFKSFGDVPPRHLRETAVLALRTLAIVRAGEDSEERATLLADLF